MKKSYAYSIVVVLFVTAIGFIITRGNRNEKKKTASSYTLQPRKKADSSEEWNNIRNRALALQQAIRNNPGDSKSILALTSIFLQEARITGNYMYYDMAALHHVNTILQDDSLNFEALTFKALILLSQHHFADGLLVAKKARQINPYNAFVYGILIDANVEMGNYGEAIENADKMVSIRPDIRSYSRIAYLREIHGDYAGAIEAMKLAVNAGAPGDETTAWCRVQLGKLYEITGDHRSAEMLYRSTLEERPSYAYALGGLARIAISNKDFTKAISLYTEADSYMIGYQFREELATAYKLAGQTDKSTAIEKEVIDGMIIDSKSGQEDENIGHYADLELSYGYLKSGNTDKALYHVLQEYNRRPNNIDVNEALAWVYYNTGQYAKALPYLKTALQTNSKNPRLLCRAGLIYAKSGEIAVAKPLLTEGLKVPTALEETLKTASTQLLKTF